MLEMEKHLSTITLPRITQFDVDLSGHIGQKPRTGFQFQADANEGYFKNGLPYGDAKIP